MRSLKEPKGFYVYCNRRGTYFASSALTRKREHLERVKKTTSPRKEKKLRLPTHLPCGEADKENPDVTPGEGEEAEEGGVEVHVEEHVENHREQHGGVGR